MKHDLNVGTTDDETANVLLLDYRMFLDRTKEDSQYLSGLDFTLLCMDIRNIDQFESDVFELWDATTKFVQRYPKMNRLLIELSDPNDTNNYFNNGDVSTHDAKLLAMKMAFVYHPSLFFSSIGEAVGKRVVSWVKDQSVLIRDRLQLGDIDDLPLLKLFCLTANEASNRVRIEIAADKKREMLQLEQRVVPMTPEQSLEFRQCCSEFEGQSAIVSLQKICLCVGLDDEFKLHQWQVSLPRRTISEPNIGAAIKILSKSSKLRELLILLLECGFGIANKQDIKNYLPSDSVLCNGSSSNSPTATKKKKVLILASIIEAQLLVSFFLSCIGIHHFMASTSFYTTSDSWDRVQMTLSHFNAEQDVNCKGTNIVISSPSDVSSLCGGICPTSADVVISLDEEWDSQNTPHFLSLMKKICCSKSSSGATCKFIKIVSEAPFENLTCSDEKKNNFNSKMCNGINMTDPLQMINMDSSVQRWIDSKHSYVGLHPPSQLLSKTALMSFIDQQTLLSYKSKFPSQRSRNSPPLSFNDRYSSTLHRHLLQDCSRQTTLQSYVQSFYSRSFRRETESQHDTNLTVTPKVAPKQETARPKSRDTSLISISMPDAKSLLIYDIPVTAANVRAGAVASDQRDAEKAFDAHHFALGFNSSRDSKKLSGLFDYSSGFQACLYLPPPMSVTANYHDNASAPSISQKRTTMDLKSQLMESNPYASFVDVKSTKHELLENGILFSGDFEMINWQAQLPIINSIILVAQEPQMQGGSLNSTTSSLPTKASANLIANSIQNNISSTSSSLNHPDNKRALPTKKIRKHHFNSVQDKFISSYFKNDKSLHKAIATRNAIRFNLLESIAQSIKLRLWLGNFLSDRSQHVGSSHDLLLDKKEFAPFLCGLKAKQHTLKLIHREWSAGGIVLPMGVKTKSRISRKQKSALEENDQWTQKEDEHLKKSVGRYGMNWRLVSKEISASGLSHRPFRHSLSSRSPSQCQSRWESFAMNKTELPICTIGNNISKRQDDEKGFFINKDSSLESSEHHHWIQCSVKTMRNHSQQANLFGASELNASLKISSKKARIVKQSIPGSSTVNGETSIMVVPVHGSHRETVQAAAANYSSRAEMWPMEFIEYTTATAASNHIKSEPAISSKPRIHQPYHGQHNGYNAPHVQQHRVPMQNASTHLPPNQHRHHPSSKSHS